GLGRSTEETDALSRTTRYGYDEFDRMIKSTLPDDVMVTRQYSPHSTGELPITIQVTPNEAGQQPIRVGTQTFDGLERLTQLNVGPRVETYEYSGSQFQVSKRTTPAGQAIDYFYVPELTEQPIRIETIEDKQSRFHYDPKTAYLGSSSNGQGQHDFDYDSAGNVTEHRWRVDGNTWTNHYRHSLGGRQLIRKDVGDVDCQYFYEKTTGRLHTLDHGYIQAQFEYDTQGRLLRTTCRDLSAGASLTTELGYDDLGRETLRTLTPNDQPPRILRQTWQADDRLQSRHLQTADGRSLLLEEFGYDQRGRLELHLCSGDELPRDRHGNEIIEQLFLFDALDNITLCRTTFKDDSRDEAEFSYSSDDACQLLKVTHTHPSYLPQSVEFEYDANGNMLNDEQGRSLQYDSQGRLVAVSDRHGVALTDYRYDPHNHLFGVKNTGQNETLRFYQNDRLSDTVQGPTHTQYLASLRQPLGQQQPDDAGQTLLLMTDGKSSVIGETQQTTLRTETYSGYGERDANSTMRSRMAFNGEVCEDITQWYLLGRGYRAYNPCLMRFHSPDSLSPFGAGGINPYMYCAGDPINFSDPTGHFFDSGWFHVFFGFVEALSGAATGNAVQLLAGTTQISAGLAMLTTDSDSDKQALGQVAGMASMIGLLSGVGRSGVVSLIKKPKAIPKITNKFYTTNNHFNTTINRPRSDSSPAILQRGKAATRNQSTMTDVARRASAPTLSNSDDVLRRGSISVSNDAPFTTSEAYVEQVLSSNRLQAPTPPIPEQIESFTTSKPMKGFKAQSELTADVRQNAYRRSAGHSYPPPGAGVFNGAGGTLALRRN
ncbi:RHS repeat domain-containing protein, partial [Pseudomonas sp. Pse1]|uniref:RHS repeat domain-containing protein n=1 Tax=Pseudomonas sp. Pse1 TaxID=2926020 RepID=UPI002741080D